MIQESASHQRSLRNGQKNRRRLQYISSSSATVMSPYRLSADISGTSNTGQLHGLDAPTLDPSTDTYIWVKAVRERPRSLYKVPPRAATVHILASSPLRIVSSTRHSRTLNNRSLTILKLKGKSTTNRMTKLLLWSRLLAFSEKSRQCL
jgi:hypothetical protein